MISGAHRRSAPGDIVTGMFRVGLPRTAASLVAAVSFAAARPCAARADDPPRPAANVTVDGRAVWNGEADGGRIFGVATPSGFEARGAF